MEELRRIRWLCRRGMKELDVLLERFVSSDYETLSPDEHDALLALLGQEDPDLWSMIMGRMAGETDTQERLLARIREFEVSQPR